MNELNKQNKRIKTGIALEGGGAKGAYEAGVFRALKALGIHYDVVTGTSIGAISAACYIMDDYEYMASIWQNLDKYFSFGKSSPSTQAPTFDFDAVRRDPYAFEKAYLDADGLDSESCIALLGKIIDEDVVRRSSVEYGLSAYCLTDKKQVNLFKNDITDGKLAEYVFASCCLPIFKARPIEGKYYIDGGVYNVLPTDMLVEKGCDRIIAVRLRPEPYDFGSIGGTEIIDIAPDSFLCGTLEIDKVKINDMLERGYKDGLKALKAIA